MIKKIVKRNRILSNLYICYKNHRMKRKRIITGRNNRITKMGDLFNVRFNITGDDNYIEIGLNSILSDTTVFICGNNNKLTVRSGVECSGGAFRFEGSDCEILIGENTTVSSASFQAIESNRKIIVGNDCMFSMGIDVWTSDFHSIINCKNGKRINEPKDVIIGNHVWVGANALLLKGITLGNNCIIAAGSIVTKSVPENSIVAGCPAKIIKNDIDWKRERII